MLNFLWRGKGLNLENKYILANILKASLIQMQSALKEHNILRSSSDLYWLWNLDIETNGYKKVKDSMIQVMKIF
jgi:hypothetical protein